MIRFGPSLTARSEQIADDSLCVPVDRKRYRVLMLLEEWGAGGTERYVASLSRYLKQHEDCEVHLGLIRKAKWGRNARLSVADQDSELDDRYGVFATVHEFRLPHIRSLRRVIATLAPDVCHCHLYSSLLPAVLALRACRIRRLIATLHMPLDAWNWRHRMMWRAATVLADHTVCSSHAIARTVVHGRAIRVGKVSVISPPVPEIPLTSLSSSGRRASPFTVCGCGRLAKEKDWPTLFRAFAAMQQRVNFPSRLVLLGGGPQEAELRELASRSGIAGSLEMLGHVDHAEALAVLQQSDVFVLPSQFEGLGMAAIEAMQCGVPTVTSDFDASGEYIEHGVTGHRFPRGDESRLCDLLVWHGVHPERSRMIGREGQEFVSEKYSEKATFTRQMSVYLDGTQSCALSHLGRRLLKESE